MVVSASEIKTNPAFSLLRERDGIPEPDTGVGEILWNYSFGISGVRMASPTKEHQLCQERHQTVEVTPPWTVPKITHLSTRRKVRKDLWKISTTIISVKMMTNHVCKKSETSMKSEAHIHFSTLPKIQGKRKNPKMNPKSSINYISRTRRFCKHLTSQDWFDFFILTFIAANCITLAVERPTIPPW